MIKHEDIWLSAGNGQKVAACDPGRTGGAVILEGDTLTHAFEWRPGKAGSWQIRTLRCPEWATCTEQDAYALPWRSLSGEHHGVIELIRPHGQMANFSKLAIAAGQSRQAMLTAGLSGLVEVQQTSWVADVLGCPPGRSTEAIRCALQGDLLPGSRRMIHWPVLSAPPLSWEHALDALAMALWAQGRRLTRAAPLPA